MNKISVFWFRRDLRLEDNTALIEALEAGYPVLPIFIFDNDILKGLPKNDARVSFIYDNLDVINNKLKPHHSSIHCSHASVTEAWEKLTKEYNIQAVFFNKDYEPYAINRDKKVTQLLSDKGITVNEYKDQVIFGENEIIKDNGEPYTVFTPYKNKWLKQFNGLNSQAVPNIKFEEFLKIDNRFPALSELGFTPSLIRAREYKLDNLANYGQTRDFPALDTTSYLGPHLRFGTVSIRQLIKIASEQSAVFLSELIWREFFMQILFHFPDVVNNNFKRKYDGIIWRNNENEFAIWCKGETGYPMVDAGMRQLNETGYMHNRVRMVTASFLCKHLLIDWRLGEAYFAEKLLDYELASNNGNWQWAAGTGCDAAPYFRIFNPYEQQKKFDKDFQYINKWLPEYGTTAYPQPIVEHKFARERALVAYKKGIKK